MSSTDNTGWQPPTPDAAQAAPPTTGQPPTGQPDQAPRYGAYGTPAVGQPPSPQTAQPGGPYPGAYGPQAGHPGGGAGYQPGYQAYGPPGQAYGPPGAGSSGPPAYGFDAFMAPRPGIIPLRPLSFSDILGGAFEALRANPRAMFVPSIIVMAAVGALTALTSLALGSEVMGIIDATNRGDFSDATVLEDAFLGYLVYAGIGMLLQTLATAILTGLLIVTVSRTILGRVATPGEVWQRTKDRVWALIGQALLISLILYGSLIVLYGAAFGLLIAAVSESDMSSSSAAAIFVLFMLGLLIGFLIFFALYIKLCLAPAALILERVGPLEGIRRSWTLTRGSFWRVTGVRIVAMIIVAIATQIVTLPLSWITGLMTAADPGLIWVSLAISSFLTALVSALILPFDSAVTALQYTDLRMRTEGLDIELRRAAEA